MQKTQSKESARALDVLFACAFVFFAIFLLSQLNSEAKFSAAGKFFAQPALWPAISIAGMVIFGLAHLWSRILNLRACDPALSSTRFSYLGLIAWFGIFEYLAWFMVYVWAVPVVGYLIATVLFATLLSVRVGYKSRRMLGIAAASGVGIVVGFKSFLGVKIPGATWYEILPNGIANFLIKNF